VGYDKECALYSCQILITREFSPQIVEEFSNAKLYGNSPLGTNLFEADRRMDGRTDVTKIIVAFRNFANAPKTLRTEIQ
jgi:hypothetical protein